MNQSKKTKETFWSKHLMKPGKDKVFYGFIAIISIAGLLIYIPNHNFYSTQKNKNELTIINEIMRTSENLYIDAMDMETGVRGYMISGNEIYLNPSIAAFNRFNSDSTEFMKSIYQTKYEKMGLELINEIENKKYILELLIETRKRPDFTNSDAFTTLAQSKKVMDAIRIRIHSIETLLRNERAAINDKQLKESKQTYFIFIGVSLFLVAIITWIWMELVKRINKNRLLDEQVSLKTKELAEVFNNMSEAVIGFNNQKYITYYNKETEIIFNLEFRSLIGKKLSDNPIKSGTKELIEFIEDAILLPQVFQEQVYIKELNKYFKINAYPDLQGNIVFIRDISIEKDAEFKLIENEKKYRYLFNNNPQVLWIINSETREFMDVNLMAIEKYGYSREEFLSMKADDIRPKEELPLFERYMKQLSTEELGQLSVWTHIKKDGTQIKVEILGHPIEINNKKARLILSSNVTERIKLEQDNIQKTEQLKLLSQHLQRAREEERLHIAREIHDELGQRIAAIKMDLSWLHKHLDNPHLKEKTSEMIEFANNTSSGIRRIASQLRPRILDDLGLLAALEWQSNDFTETFGIKCSFESNLEDEIFSLEDSIAYFRIFQESLTNIVKHSKAKQVYASLMKIDNKLEMCIQDDGVGLNPEAISEGFGLIGMRERAEMINAELYIQNANPGTKICLIKVRI